MSEHKDKRKILEAAGYQFFVATNPFRVSFIINPDGWTWQLDNGVDIYDPEYDAKQMKQLIDKAWEHYQE